MRREDLEKQLDKLNEAQLQQITDFIALIEAQPLAQGLSTALWQRTTATERAREFREWVAQLPKHSQSLPNAAFDRETIYGE